MNPGVGLIIAFLLTLAFCSPSHAYPIEYSWEGTIVPNGPTDPWLVGIQGQPFTLHGVVSSTAPDLLDIDVQFAAFTIDNAQLVVAGQNVPYVRDGTIDFTNNSAGTF